MQTQAGLVSAAGCYHHGVIAFMEGLVLWDPPAQFRLHTLPQLVIGSIPAGNYSGKDGINVKD